MDNLLFCTSYITDLSLNRYISWLMYYSELYKADVEYLIVNDGPLKIEYKKALQKLAFDKNIILHLKDFELKRGQELYKHWGWWRSFLFALELGKNNYNHIIHIESDAIVVSERLKKYLIEKDSGWLCLHTPTYGFKESAIQKINIDSFHMFENLDPNFDFHKIIELYLPMRRNINFIGDRYGESGKLPNHQIDYVCQWNWDWAIDNDWIIK